MYKVRLKLRKVVAIAICLAGITIFSGCEKDKDNKADNPNNPGNNPPITTIVGKWIVEKATVTKFECESGVSQELQDAIRNGLVETYDEEFVGSIWNFHSDGKATLTWSDGEEAEDDGTTYSVEGNILKIIDPDGYFTLGQYSIFGNKLYWDIDALSTPDPDIEELIEMGIKNIIIRVTFNKKQTK
jgi:hypothetical protein